MESEPEWWFQVIIIYLQLRLKIREGIQGDNAVRLQYIACIQVFVRCDIQH